MLFYLYTEKSIFKNLVTFRQSCFFPPDRWDKWVGKNRQIGEISEWQKVGWLTCVSHFASRIDSNCCVFTSPESGPWLMSSIGMQRFLLIFIMSWARDNCINIATRWKRLWRVKIWKCSITPVEWNSHIISKKVLKWFDIFSLKEEVLTHSVVYCRVLSAFLKIDLFQQIISYKSQNIWIWKVRLFCEAWNCLMFNANSTIKIIHNFVLWTHEVKI